MVGSVPTNGFPSPHALWKTIRRPGADQKTANKIQEEEFCLGRVGRKSKTIKIRFSNRPFHPVFKSPVTDIDLP
jgi:hypothetical protein